MRAGGDVWLKRVTGWWRLLAAGLAEQYPASRREECELTARQTIESLVLLRLCQDRGLAPPDAPAVFSGKRDLWPRLVRWLDWLETQYGSALCRARRGGDAGEDFFPRPATGLPDDLLEPIVRQLSGPDATVLTAGPEILGRIHERLLDLRLSGSQRPAKRAFGVYYTPEYVCQYIVDRTLATLPDPSWSLLDPACGAGSFLLAACRRLKLDEFRATWSGPADLAGRLHGVDLDAEAVLAARRSLWLEIVSPVGNALRGVPEVGDGSSGEPRNATEGVPYRGMSHDYSKNPVDREMARAVAQRLGSTVECGDVLLDPIWEERAGRFDWVVGNPPYRRELNTKPMLDAIAASPLGRRYRAPRMDLWYYFLHRGLELLKPGGRLSYIVGAYWTSGSGARHVIRALRESAEVEEIFSLGGLKVFPRVAGRHLILRVRKGPGTRPATIKVIPPDARADAEPYVRGGVPVATFIKSPEQLFRDGRIDLEPPCEGILARLSGLATLGHLGHIRQGIAENPAAVTAAVNRRHGGRWTAGEGVFALTPQELQSLQLPESEAGLVRPYHDLRDLGRYYLAEESSLRLIYSTPRTCPDITHCPVLHRHLERFRPIMEQRRETLAGTRAWWQLHWPREEPLWLASKLIAVQMAARPAIVPAHGPVYVPFSANVFLPYADVNEHLHYLAALLNSRLLWRWYRHHAKRRGLGLEINGHVLARSPIRRIDRSSQEDQARHDRLVGLVELMLAGTRQLRDHPLPLQEVALRGQLAQIDRQIDQVVYELCALGDDEIASLEQ
jgi:hypothetical protein